MGSKIFSSVVECSPLAGTQWLVVSCWDVSSHCFPCLEPAIHYKVQSCDFQFCYFFIYLLEYYYEEKLCYFNSFIEIHMPYSPPL